MECNFENIPNDNNRWCQGSAPFTFRHERDVCEMVVLLQICRVKTSMENKKEYMLANFFKCDKVTRKDDF